MDETALSISGETVAPLKTCQRWFPMALALSQNTQRETQTSTLSVSPSNPELFQISDEFITLYVEKHKFHIAINTPSVSKMKWNSRTQCNYPNPSPPTFRSQMFKTVHVGLSFPHENKSCNKIAPVWRCNSITLVRPLAPTRARTRDPMHTSTTVTHKASLPIAPQKPRPLQSKGNHYFKVSEQVTSPIETLFSAHHR